MKRRKSSSRCERVGLVAVVWGVSLVVRRPGDRVRRAARCGWRGEALDVGLVDGAGEGSVVEDVGEVEERSGGGGDRDALLRRGVLVVGVDADTGVAPAARRRHLDRRVPSRNDPPERRRRPMTQSRAGTAREYGRHRRGERRRRAVAHGVNPAMKEVETPDLEAIRDRTRSNPSASTCARATTPCCRAANRAREEPRVWSIESNYWGQVTTPPGYCGPHPPGPPPQPNTHSSERSSPHTTPPPAQTRTPAHLPRHAKRATYG